MADALASGASVRKDVGVQVPPEAPPKFSCPIRPPKILKGKVVFGFRLPAGGVL